MNKESEQNGSLDIFEKMTVLSGPIGRFERLDMQNPIIPDFELRRIEKRDADLNNTILELLTSGSDQNTQ